MKIKWVDRLDPNAISDKPKKRSVKKSSVKKC
jgi:hypothetical protein